METVIRGLRDADVEAVVAFAVDAWAPVFEGFEVALGSAVYGLLFPDWRLTQAGAVEAVCRSPDHETWVAVADGRPVGFVAVCDVKEGATRAGEIVMVAVELDHQADGIGTSLVRRAMTELHSRGIRLAVVATGGDPGHAPARALYETLGFHPLPQVRYHRQL